MRAVKHPGLVLRGKYSDQAGRHIEGFMAEGANLLRADRRLKRRSMNMVARHNLLGRETLPIALEAAREVSPGSVLVTLNHKNMSPDAVPHAMRILKKGGWEPLRRQGLHDVISILNHPKTTRETARRFLEIAQSEGVGTTRSFMDRKGVDASNIESRIRDYKKMGKTQRIVLS